MNALFWLLSSLPCQDLVKRRTATLETKRAVVMEKGERKAHAFIQQVSCFLIDMRFGVCDSNFGQIFS